MSPTARKRQLLAVEAKTARANLDQTLGLVRKRLMPRAVVAEAAELITARASEVAHDATAGARKRPLIIGAGVIGAGALAVLGFFIRRRLRETKTKDDRSSSRLEIK